ncbi:MAG: peroxide stress protein YaaA [Filifactor alocis]|nr:peroxide stress protein YaaA [Filifactor alocis]
MRIIISPAKKMRVDNDGLEATGLPVFLDEAEKIKALLQTLSKEELKELYRSNENIASLNYDRLQETDLKKNLTPALFAYEGIQYQYMAPQIFEEAQLDYVQEHLRILSGLYGILHPLDGVVPYRLEMQAKLRINSCKNLYEFWGGRIAEHLAQETDCIVNLASLEYSKIVSKHLPKDFRFITCVFGERTKDRIVEKGTMCKMARGRMVRFMAVNAITEPKHLKDFDSDYAYSEEDSDASTYVFVKKE